MRFSAARLGDWHVCPDQKPLSSEVPGGCSEAAIPATSVPHVGGPVTGPGSTTVLIEGKPAARVGDLVFCAGVAVTDIITTGVANVKINGRLAAAVGSRVRHAGPLGEMITTGASRVTYGGPLTGAVLGDEAAATAACHRAYAGKKIRGQTKEMGCGQETVRLICVQKNDPPDLWTDMTQDDFYQSYLLGPQLIEEHNRTIVHENQSIDMDNNAQWKKMGESGDVYRQKRRYKKLDGNWAQDPYPSSKDRVVDFNKETWADQYGMPIYRESKHSDLCKNSEGKMVPCKGYVSISPAERLSAIPTDESERQRLVNEGSVGSTVESRRILRERNGIESDYGDNTVAGIGKDLANKKTVIASVDIAQVNPGRSSGAHAVTVSQMRFRDDGSLENVIINDTADDVTTCGKVVRGDVFEHALNVNRRTNVIP